MFRLRKLREREERAIPVYLEPSAQDNREGEARKQKKMTARMSFYKDPGPNIPVSFN
jgi:hypothetical protein